MPRRAVPETVGVQEGNLLEHRARGPGRRAAEGLAVNPVSPASTPQASGATGIYTL